MSSCALLQGLAAELFSLAGGNQRQAAKQIKAGQSSRLLPECHLGISVECMAAGSAGKGHEV